MALTKDRQRIGVMCSDANPPHMIEFLTAVQAIAEFKIDRVLYAVTDGRFRDEALLETKKHRYAMATMAVKTFEPFITPTDLGDLDHGVEKTMMANGQERPRSDGEDYAFRLFEFNPDERITLVFMTECEHCRRVDDTGRDDTINKLLANIRRKYSGFNPAMHNVMGLFIGELAQIPPGVKFGRDEQTLVDGGVFYSGVFTIEFMRRPALKGVPTKPQDLSLALRDALQGRGLGVLALLSPDVHNYIEAHPDYKERLLRSPPA